ncbi:MAG: hypothetical protein ACREFP_11695 [Acetobacteraceae bacterium]
MIETQRTQTEMLAKLIEAATPSDGPHPLEEAMTGVTAALRDQTVVLERVETEIGGLGAEVEAGVMRGLAGALGVDAEPSAPHRRLEGTQTASGVAKSERRQQKPGRNDRQPAAQPTAPGA